MLAISHLFSLANGGAGGEPDGGGRVGSGGGGRVGPDGRSRVGPGGGVEPEAHHPLVAPA